MNYNNTNKETRTELTKSEKNGINKFFKCTYLRIRHSSTRAFYSGSLLGILAWSRRILEIIFQLLAASLDIIFPELSKAKNKDEVTEIRTRLRKVFIFSFFHSILFFLVKGLAGDIVCFFM